MSESNGAGYLQYATDHYETWVGLGLAEALVFGGVTAFEAAPIISDFSVAWKIFCYCIPLVIIAVHWSLNRFRLPRNQKGKIGIVVAIYCEEKYQETRLRNDFLAQLKEQLRAVEPGNINLIPLRNHQSMRIVEGMDEKLSRDLHRKTKSHYILFGSVKKRQATKPTYYIHLDGSILHLDLGPQVKNAVACEFQAVLNRTVDFEEIAELKGFEATADMVARSVKFIVGIAALVSFDIDLAYRLHLLLYSELGSLAAPDNQLIELTKKLRRYLCDEERLLAAVRYSQGRNAEGQTLLSRLLLRDPKNYGGLLLQGVIDFQEGRASKSLDRILQARQWARHNQEWRYSLAFLYFWLGKYQQALEVCTQIQKHTYPNEGRTIAEVRDFLDGLLNKEGVRSQVYFWQGFVLYKKANHLPGALAAFEEFERRASPGEGLLKRRSATYLGEIKLAMGIL